MKFTIFLGDTEEIKVKNETEKDFAHRFLPIKAGETVKGNIHTVKNALGNWDDHTPGEVERRVKKGIDTFELLFKELPKEKVKKELVGKKEITNSKEPEFLGLDEEDEEPCQAVKKNGEPCKNKAVDNGFCKFHQVKE